MLRLKLVLWSLLSPIFAAIVYLCLGAGRWQVTISHSSAVPAGGWCEENNNSQKLLSPCTKLIKIFNNCHFQTFICIRWSSTFAKVKWWQVLILQMQEKCLISLSLLSIKQKIETNYKIGDFGCVVSACLNMLSVIAQTKSHEKMITITLNCVTSHQ